LGSKIEVKVTVDPALIGGLIVKVGSRMIDSSVRTKLNKLQIAMKGVG
jgi:F-type H+-transporting ATPase subunit delta